MFRLISLLGPLLLSYVPSLVACEGCKEPSSVAGDSGVGGISASFSWSVVFMLGMLAFLLTGLLFMIVRSCKQLAEQQQHVNEVTRFAAPSSSRASRDGSPGSATAFGVREYAAAIPAVQP